MLSKKERKLLAEKALQDRDEEFQEIHIISDLDLSLTQWVSTLKKELKNFNVNLELSINDNQSIQIYVPNIGIESSCFLTVGEGSDIAEIDFELYEGASADSMLERLSRNIVVTLSGQRRKNDVINLVFNTSIRILGRISKGTLIDVEQEYIGSDWVAWSCDYYEKDLFKAFNCESLREQYPVLVVKKWWGIF